MVSHEILIRKLNAVGVKDKALDWITSYLNNRKQYTRANDISSSIRLVPNRVPQGSSLGLLLFIYYINDIIDLTSRENVLLFADDVVIFEGKQNQKELESVLQQYLDKVVTWCTNNRMKMNIMKTKLVTINGNCDINMTLHTPCGNVGNTST